MMQTRSLEGLCHAAVTVTLLLTFSASSWGTPARTTRPSGHRPLTRRHGPEAAPLNRPPAVIPPPTT